LAPAQCGHFGHMNQLMTLTVNTLCNSQYQENFGTTNIIVSNFCSKPMYSRLAKTMKAVRIFLLKCFDCKSSEKYLICFVLRFAVNAGNKVKLFFVGIGGTKFFVLFTKIRFEVSRNKGKMVQTK